MKSPNNRGVRAPTSISDEAFSTEIGLQLRQGPVPKDYTYIKLIKHGEEHTHVHTQYKEVYFIYRLPVNFNAQGG